MKKIITLVIFSIIFIGCPAKTVIIEEPSKGESPPYNDKANWWFLWEDEEGEIFISLDNITYSPEGLVRIWLKETVTSKGKEIETKIRRGMKVSTEGLKNLSYRINLVEMDCPNRMVRSLETFNYDNSGKLIYDPVDYIWTMAQRDKWQHIPPGTKIWHLYRYLCQ